MTLPLENAIAYQTGAYWLHPDRLRLLEHRHGAVSVGEVNRQVQAKCTGQYMLDTSTTTSPRVAWPRRPASPAGWWIRTDVSGGAGYATYMTVRPVGDSIQMVFLYNDS